MLHAGVEGPCPHRPENWLMRQLNDEPKQVSKVEFIREKGKATVRELQRSLEASDSLKAGVFMDVLTLCWWVFLIGHGFEGFLR
jgi:hypothetical protein